MKLMEKKLLVCDLDGTLLDAEGKVDQDSLMKIKRFCEDGGHFVICTGRMDSDIQYVEEKLGFKGEYRISQNGAVIKNSHDELIFFECLPAQYIASLNQAIFEMNLRTEVSTVKNRLFPSPRDPKDVAEFVDTSIVVEDLPNYVLNHQNELTIYLTFGTAAEKNLGTQKVNVVQTSPTSLEVFSVNVSKGNAVRFIMEQLNMTGQDIYVVGDAQSDVSMFELTKHAYAVREAHATVIAQASDYQETVGHVVDEMYSKMRGAV